MPITRTAIIDDDGSGTSGTVIDNAWKQELYNQIDGLAAPLGAWSPVAFNAANFPSLPGITAGQVELNQFAVINKTMLWMVKINGAPITPGGYLFLVVPDGRSITAAVSPLAYGVDGGTFTPGYVLLGAATQIALAKSNAAGWTTNLTAHFTAILSLV